MITIHVQPRKITVQGHAKRLPGANPGRNIICAGVSALTLTLVEGLREVARLQVEATLEPGNTSISWDEDSFISEALVRTWLLGIQGIRDSYGEITII